MSAQFFNVHLKFTPKSVSLAAPIGSPHEIVLEVPRGLMRQADLVGQDFTEKAIVSRVGFGYFALSCGRIPPAKVLICCDARPVVGRTSSGPTH